MSEFLCKDCNHKFKAYDPYPICPKCLKKDFIVCLKRK